MEDMNRKNIATEYDKDIRVYITEDKVHLPSVTSIANFIEKEWLSKWRANNEHWADILLYAGTVGTMSHWRFGNDLAEEWGLPTETLELNPQQQKALEMWGDNFPFDSKRQGIEDAVSINYATFIEWKEKFQPKPPFIILKNGKKRTANIHPIEKLIFSKKFGFAGSLDLLCSIYDKQLSKDINIINDFKTNFEVYPSYQLQLTGYKLGLLEMYPNMVIDKLYITNISSVQQNWNFTPQMYNKRKWLENVLQFYILNENIPDLRNHAQKMITNIESELDIMN